MDSRTKMTTRGARTLMVRINWAQPLLERFLRSSAQTIGDIRSAFTTLGCLMSVCFEH